MGLTEFLLARITEDEAVALAMPMGVNTSSVPDSVSDFLAAFAPGRVLAECEAKRRIVEFHESLEGDPYGEIKDRVVYWCAECDHDRDYGGIPHEEDGCRTLRALALPYADHPDYDEGWKP